MPTTLGPPELSVVPAATRLSMRQYSLSRFNGFSALEYRKIWEMLYYYYYIPDQSH